MSSGEVRMDDRSLRGRALIAEYEELKRSQRDHIRAREGTRYGLLAAAAGAFVWAERVDEVGLVLLVPALALWLGLQYCEHEDWIRAADRHIVSVLDARLRELEPAQGVVFGWEAAHGVDPDGLVRKLRQLTMNLCLFALVPGVALGIVGHSAEQATWELVGGLELLGISVLTPILVLRAELRLWERWCGRRRHRGAS